MVELTDIRYFLAVAEELHFGRAALRLGIAQPSLTERIARIERNIDARLFDRTNRRVELTAAGSRFRDLVIRVPYYAERARLAVLPSDEAGSPFIVAASRLALFDLMPRTLPVFAARNRAIRCQIIEEDNVFRMREMLLNGSIDLLLTQSAYDGGEVRHLGSVREDAVLAQPGEADHTDAERLPVIEIISEEHAYRRRAGHDGYLEAESRSMVCSSVVGALALVAAGLGTALLPASVKGLQQRSVRYRKPTGEKAHISYGLLAAEEGSYARSRSDLEALARALFGRRLTPGTDIRP